MAQAKQGDVVKVHYTGMLNDGSTFESTFDGEPLEFEVGDKQVLYAFEQAVVGMEPGETNNVEIPAEKAYGKRCNENIIKMNRNELPEDMKLKVGQKLQIRHPNGNAMVVTVSEVSSTSVTLDTNNPLAGEDLSFEIELVEIS